MNIRKAVLVLMTIVALPISASAFAAGTNQSTGRAGGGGGDNPLSSDRGNDMGGVNPNFPTGCFRTQGPEFSVICPYWNWRGSVAPAYQ